jgi:hypothetical protein
MASDDYEPSFSRLDLSPWTYWIPFFLSGFGVIFSCFGIAVIATLHQQFDVRLWCIFGILPLVILHPVQLQMTISDISRAW